MDTAKVFWSGRSQAVRLPKEFRVEGDVVRVRRHGAAVILEPIAMDWNWLDALTGPVDTDLQQATEDDSPPRERAGLDAVFDR